MNNLPQHIADQVQAKAKKDYPTPYERVSFEAGASFLYSIQPTVRWVAKTVKPLITQTFPIRYLIDGGYIYSSCIYNKDFGWQGYDIFDFEYLEELPSPPSGSQVNSI